jgi:predicted nucleic acid-binding protein
VIYLDSSALLKLLFEEQESDALQVWLEARESVAKISSELAKVEVVRATRRLAPDAVPVAMSMLSQLDLVPLSGGVVDQAAVLGEPALRSLDAIHLASAVTLGTDLTAFIAYDHRLSAAASNLGLAVVQPGA